MSSTEFSTFEERSGIVPANCSWGKWWQTVNEVHHEVNLPEGTSAKEVSVDIKPHHISCSVRGETKFAGELFALVHPDETVWTIEDRKLLRIVLVKASTHIKEGMWESLLVDGQFGADPGTLHKMRQKLDLERFQVENPGFDFSSAKLNKAYDTVPGVSQKQ